MFFGEFTRDTLKEQLADVLGAPTYAEGERLGAPDLSVDEYFRITDDLSQDVQLIRQYA